MIEMKYEKYVEDMKLNLDICDMLAFVFDTVGGGVYSNGHLNIHFQVHGGGGTPPGAWRGRDASRCMRGMPPRIVGEMGAIE